VKTELRMLFLFSKMLKKQSRKEREKKRKKWLIKKGKEVE
jgi:hypothetical protein